MKKILSLVFVILGLGALAAAIVFLRIARDIPSLDLLEHRQTAESTKIYDRTGEVLLYELHGDERRTIIRFADVPETVKQATLAAEDVGFYEHPAFDWRAVIRALLVNVRRGAITQGGSTITQQLAKNAFLTPERTLTRKIKELILAIRLERQYSKDRIFELYLNQIPYGSNAYGIEAASQLYFAKPMRDLSLAETAVLAAMTRAPTYYSPWGSHAEELLARKNFVLEKMKGAGFITSEAYETALADQPAFSRPSSDIKAPHFVIAVQEYLAEKYGEEFVRTGGLRVTTTLDWNLQATAEKAVAEGVARNEELYKGTNAALVAEDAGTGQVLALVGSRNYFDTEHEGNFNVATQGLRQPGSAMKPFVYATAFEKGYTPDTVVFDFETEFDTSGDPERSYKPQNFDERFRGPVKLRDALAQSLNVPSVKVLYLAGIDAVLENARQFGISTLNERARYGLSLVLGGGEVKLIELAHAYSVFAQEGIKHAQTLVLRVELRGRALEAYRDNAERVIDAQYARLINDILSDVEARAALFSASLPLTVFPDREVALKTGTTDDYRDAWAFGYTPSFVVGVWAGNNDNTPLQKHGGSILAAVPIWSAFLKEALRERPVETFTKPEPMLASKPVLAGEHLVTYRLNGQLFPQIHDILFYVDRKNPAGPEPREPERDPQFENWEKPVLSWAAGAIPDFNRYNQPIPEGSEAVFGNNGNANAGRLEILITKPQNGAFIKSILDLEASIDAPAGVNRFEVRLNGSLLDSRMSLPGGAAPRFQYQNSFFPPRLELQNLLEFFVTDKNNNSVSKKLILFKS